MCILLNFVIKPNLLYDFYLICLIMPGEPKTIGRELIYYLFVRIYIWGRVSNTKIGYWVLFKPLLFNLSNYLVIYTGRRMISFARFVYFLLFVDFLFIFRSFVYIFLSLSSKSYYVYRKENESYSGVVHLLIFANFILSFRFFVCAVLSLSSKSTWQAFTGTNSFQW